MNISYKRENHKSYMVIKEITAEKEQNGFSMKMLWENEIKGLLPVSQHVFNGEKELYYDISAKQPLDLIYEKRGMAQKDLKGLLMGLLDTIQNMEEYLLEEDSLFLTPESIYISSADGMPYFMYYPDEEKAEERAYGLAEYLLNKVSREEEDAVISAYEFYRYVKEEKGNLSEALSRLNLKEERTAKDEMEFYEESIIEPDPIQTDMEEQSGHDVIGERDFKQEEKKSGYGRYMRTVFFFVMGLGGLGILFYSAWHYGLDMQTILSKKESIIGLGICVVSIGGFILFSVMDRLEKRRKENAVGEEDFLKEQWEKQDDIREEWIEEGECFREETEEKEDKADVLMETVLIEENCYQEQRILTGKIKGRKKQIDLSSFPFIIGKNKEQADFVLDDHSVSRLHARFTLRDDVVYLTDLNSTNGTYKNGVRLEPNELTMLEAEDEIAFGRLTFTYH
ncbi:MAG: FHA domain-containing protein [Lachnospiraceae bacterium]|nr:FHA domain-containing protein [Lachnospiraceae bacterium]